MVNTSWCGPTALPRHGPIDAFLPRSGGFPALQPRRHLLGAGETPHTDNDQGNMPTSICIAGDKHFLAQSTGALGIEGQLTFEVHAAQARPNVLCTTSWLYLSGHQL